MVFDHAQLTLASIEMHELTLLQVIAADVHAILFQVSHPLRIQGTDRKDTIVGVELLFQFRIEIIIVQIFSAEQLVKLRLAPMEFL